MHVNTYAHLKKSGTLLDGFLFWKRFNKFNICLHKVGKQFGWKHAASGKQGNVLMIHLLWTPLLLCVLVNHQT